MSKPKIVLRKSVLSQEKAKAWLRSDKGQAALVKAHQSAQEVVQRAFRSSEQESTSVGFNKAVQS